MENNRNRLLYKFAVIFFNFTVITLVISGLMTYASQMNTFTRMCRENSRQLGSYLAGLMSAEGHDIAEYKELFMEHYRDLEIPYDFDEYLTAQEEFEDLFAEKYPGMNLGDDIKPSELSEDVQKAYLVYTHEYWVLTFERARDAFDQAYTYFLVMGDPRARVEDILDPERDDHDTVHNVFYMIDGERTENTVMNVNGEKIGTGTLFLGDSYGNKRETHLVEWETWEKGECLDEYYEWNNAWGHTYTYYTPLIIDGEKIGLVCTDVEVTTINGNIIGSALAQIGGIAVILVICVVAMLWFINRFYITKINALEGNVRKYTEDKDAQIADEMEKSAQSDDEIDSLSKQTASMIREIDRHLTQLTKMTSERERFGAELSVATKIQEDMMPKNFPKRKDLDMYAIMSPAKLVGGDFYDFFFIDSNHLGLVMADVSGKGVPAALFMVIATAR